MVVGDLGNVNVADPRQRFQEDVDMWSVGCLAAELSARRPLYDPEAHAEQSGTPAGKRFLDAITAIVGGPGQEGFVYVTPVPAAAWLDSLPFLEKFYKQSGQDWLTSAAATAKPRPPPRLRGCPEGLAQLARKSLIFRW